MLGYLLVEVGSESSTLEEAKYSAALLANCLAEVLTQSSGTGSDTL